MKIRKVADLFLLSMWCALGMGVVSLQAEEPITIELPPQPLKDAVEQLAKRAAISVVFDDPAGVAATRPMSTKFAVRDMGFLEALDLLLRSYKMERMEVGPKTYLIVLRGQGPQPAGTATVRPVKLSYIEVGEAQSFLQNVFQQRVVQGQPQSPLKFAADPRRNLLVLMGDPEVVDEAENLLRRDLDKPTPQVLILVSVIEANLSRLDETGWQLAQYQMPSTKLLPSERFFRLSFDDFPAIINYLATRGEAKIMATQKVIALDRKRASIDVVERVPYRRSRIDTNIPGLQAQQVQSGGIPSVTSQSIIDFIEAGVKLSFTPLIHWEAKEVTLDPVLEVSSLTRISDVEQIPVEGKRRVSNTIRVKHGETVFLGGLTREDERATFSGLPVLSDLPLIGGLFGNTKKEKITTEIILRLSVEIQDVPLPKP